MNEFLRSRSLLPLAQFRRLSRVVLLALTMSVAATAAGAAGAGAVPALGLHYGRDDSISQYEAFGEWLGRKILYRVVFCDMSSWNGIASPWFLSTSKQWVESHPGRVEVITMPLLPKGEDGNFHLVSSGSKDQHFRAFAERVQARGIADRVIVRLGWEGNGDWYPWAYAANPAGYRAAFRQAVEVMRETAPQLRFEWCITARATRRGGPAGWKEGYPGDDVVDIISMDTYDEYQPTWEGLRDGEAGLREFREFAIARGKIEAYPEWGCSVNTSAQGGGDNAAFVENLTAWFQSRPGGVLYQAYWNVSSGGPNAILFSLTSETPVPKAAAAFRRLYSQMRRPESESLD